ncbi:MAG: tRNA pseudouridine(55) synthase TruB [Candidatus Adiutrix sp.]|jgi:tRNA pseudouridine55 synthase|nr:tRNA pseudouridine(55) synthase TruB [Candidatus Adiutrix sp.]
MTSPKSSRWHGLILVDKPKGITSHDVVAGIRRLAGQKRVGHTGTLDPMATGLLVVLLGAAARLEPYLTRLDKTYSGVIELGRKTDTDDSTGRTLYLYDGFCPDEGRLLSAFEAMKGEIEQTPPDYSAVKVGGQRAYKAARAGRPLTLKPRLVTVYRLALTAYRPPFAEFAADVSAGCYIRSLARDLGVGLGLGGACLTALRRESVGPWPVSKAVSLETLSRGSEDDWRRALMSPAEALPHLPGVVLDEDQRRDFISGRRVAAQPVLLAGRVVSGPYKVQNPEGDLLGIGEFFSPSSLGGDKPWGPFLRPLRVFPYGS